MVYVSISSTKETINTHRHNLFSPRNTVNSTVTRRTDFFFFNFEGDFFVSFKKNIETGSWLQESMARNCFRRRVWGKELMLNCCARSAKRCHVPGYQ